MAQFVRSTPLLRATAFIVFAALLNPLLVLSEEDPQSDRIPTYVVSRVVDGDTVELLMDGTKVKVRLKGVDTPETVHPQKPVEFYGKESSTFTRNLLRGESVLVEFGEGSNKDKYGRLLAYVYRATDSLFVNQEIVRQGYGHAYTRYPFKYMEQFREYERLARESGRGLWRQALPQNIELTTGVPDAAESNEIELDDEAPKATIVFVTETGSKYHLSGCRYLSKSKIRTSLERAKKTLTPCKVCRPPR